MWCEVYKYNSLVDEGIFTAGMMPTVIDKERYISFADDASRFKTINERTYYHSDKEGTYFLVYNDIGLYYDSRGLKCNGIISCMVKQKESLEMKYCDECRKEHPANEFYWVYDRYRIPYKKVCGNCYKKVDKEIKQWVLDPYYAGECLEEIY